MIELHDCTPGDRQHAIECAARVMETAGAKLQQSATLEIGGQKVQVMFARLPSGALRVHQRDTGAVLAQSVPPFLTVLDPELFGIELDAACEQALDSLVDCLTAGRVLQGLAEVLALPCFQSLTLPELAHVLSVWAEQQGDD